MPVGIPADRTLPLLFAALAMLPVAAQAKAGRGPTPLFTRFGERALEPPAWVIEDQALYDEATVSNFGRRFLLADPRLRRSTALELTLRFKPSLPPALYTQFTDDLPVDAYLELLLVQGRHPRAAIRFSAYPELPSGLYRVDGFRYIPLDRGAGLELRRDRIYRIHAQRKPGELVVAIDDREVLRTALAPASSGWGLSAGSWPFELLSLRAQERGGAWIELLRPPVANPAAAGARWGGLWMALLLIAPLYTLGRGAWRRLLLASLWAGLVLLPGILYRAPPFEIPSLNRALVTTLAIGMAGLGIATLGKLRVRSGQRPLPAWLLCAGSVLAAGAAPILIRVSAPPQTPEQRLFALGLAALSLALALLATAVRHESSLPAYNWTCLGLAGFAFAALELALGPLPRAEWDRIYGPPLVLRNRTEADYWPGGNFRGRRVRPLKPQDTERVICIGGSSVYGFPYRAGRYAFPALAEQILNLGAPGADQPARRWEVVNAGIKGFSSFLSMEALERLLLDYRPDVVVVCARFNDSIRWPRWFAELPALTDAQAWRSVEALSRAALLRRTVGWLDRVGSFRLLRALLHSLGSAASSSATSYAGLPVRGTPEEFEQHLTRIASLGQQRGYQTVFMVEADAAGGSLGQVRRRNRYVDRMVVLSERSGAALVDGFAALEPHRGDWLFHDYIHPTGEGHRILGDALAQTLRALRPTAPSGFRLAPE